MTDTPRLVLNTDAVGPVAARFVRSRAFIRGIMGPVGSGKTTACIDAIVQSALWQRPDANGIRHVKWRCVRDTYPNLEKTTIASWHKWFPSGVGEWSWGPPPSHVLKWTLNGVRDAVVVEIEFRAIGDHSISDIMQGWEGTGLWLNEAAELNPDVLSVGMTRLGRWPADPAWYGVICDFNAPDVDNWCYRLFVERDLALPASVQAEVDRINGGQAVAFFRQPGGRDAGAENHAHLPKGYYERMLIGQRPDYIRRYVDNEFGFSRGGQPVYPEFNDQLHVAPAPMVADKGLPLLIGLDAGLTPAAVVGQAAPNGQLRILAELAVFAQDGAMLDGMGPKRFGEALARLLSERFGTVDLSAIYGFADPASAHGADTEGGELPWFQAVAKASGVRIRPADSNNLTARLEAVRLPLTRLIDGHVPGLLICPSAKLLRRGFNSKYIYRRSQLASGVGYRFEDKPAKNEYSHVHDALQYLALSTGKAGRMARLAETARAAARGQYPLAQADYEEFAA